MARTMLVTCCRFAHSYPQGVDENTRQYLSALVDAVEHFWLESIAAQVLLQELKVPNWSGRIWKYCQRSEAKALAQRQFAPARAILQQVPIDSAALVALVSALGTPERVAAKAAMPKRAARHARSSRAA